MRKFLLFIGIAICGVTAQAQQTRQALYFGPKMGMNMSNIYNEQEVISDRLFGANVGGVANVKFTKKHALQAEVAYSGKGFKLKQYNTKNTLHYIDMPLLYQHTFCSTKKGGHLAEMKRSGNLFLVLGPQVSVLMKSNVQFEGEAAGLPEIDMYSNTRPFDMSAIGGLGYAMKNGVTVDLRYALGLRHLHAANTSAYIPQEVSNTAVQLSVGYLIPVSFK